MTPDTLWTLVDPHGTVYHFTRRRDATAYDTDTARMRFILSIAHPDSTQYLATPNILTTPREIRAFLADTLYRRYVETGNETGATRDSFWTIITPTGAVYCLSMVPTYKREGPKPQYWFVLDKYTHRTHSPKTTQLSQFQKTEDPNSRGLFEYEHDGLYYALRFITEVEN